MNGFPEVGRWRDLGDRIGPETMARCRDNIVDKCRAIEREVTKPGGGATRIEGAGVVGDDGD